PRSRGLVPRVRAKPRRRLLLRPSDHGGARGPVVPRPAEPRGPEPSGRRGGRVGGAARRRAREALVGDGGVPRGRRLGSEPWIAPLPLRRLSGDPRAAPGAAPRGGAAHRDRRSGVAAVPPALGRGGGRGRGTD